MYIYIYIHTYIYIYIDIDVYMYTAPYIVGLLLQRSPIKLGFFAKESESLTITAYILWVCQKERKKERKKEKERE